jgi:hypothetical protein
MIPTILLLIIDPNHSHINNWSQPFPY